MIRKFSQNAFFQATFLMYLATAFSSLGSYLYHFLMARMLPTRADLGELESAIAFFYILSVPLTTLSIVVMKFVSSYKGRDEIEKISGLYSYLFKRLLVVGILGTVFLLGLSPIINSYLHVTSPMIGVLIALNFAIGVIFIFYRGMAQGITNFLALAASSLSESVGKIIISVILVGVGLSVIGGLIGYTLSGILGIFVLYFFVKSFRVKKSSFTQQKDLLRYSITVFLTVFGMSSIIASDVILVRHFFPGNISGDYAILSIMGKVIFFALSPITQVVFPFVSEKHARGDSYARYLFGGFLLTLCGGIVMIALFFWQEKLLIFLLPGERYMSIAPLLGIMGIFYTLYTLSSLLSNFLLSIHESKQNIIIVPLAIVQIIGIYIFHANLQMVIFVSIGTTFALFICLLIYYAKFVKQSFIHEIVKLTQSHGKKD